MAFERTRNWIHPHTFEGIEQAQEWARQHYMEHQDEDSKRLLDYLVYSMDCTGPLTIHQNDDTIVISHDGTHAYIKWDDGNLVLATDEGTNTNTTIAVQGKGTGYAQIQIYDEDEEEYMVLRATGGVGRIYTTGTADVGVRIGDVSNYTQIAPDGEITLVGTARVVKNAWLPFSGLKAPTVSPAVLVDHGVSGAWEFSDGTDDTIVANFQLPFDMDKTVAPVITLGWSTATTVTTETAVWQLEYLYSQLGENTAAAAQATINVSSNAAATTNGLVLAELPTLAVPHADDVCLHTRVKRLGADGSDDLTDTAELHGMFLKYTSNKLGTAT